MAAASSPLVRTGKSENKTSQIDQEKVGGGGKRGEEAKREERKKEKGEGKE
jgi:hypothetical protein